MAMQVGLSRIIILIGAGSAGTILLQKNKLSDLLAELQGLLNGKKDVESEGDSDVLSAQIRRLAMEVKQLASGGHSVTVLNGGSGQTALTSLVVPAAVVGALGYGYLKWKGLSFADLMYVTKQNMTAAVTNLTKHLETVTEAVAATKRHLTQRIENLDGRVQDQVELSKLIRNDISDVRDDISQVTFFLDDMERRVYALGDKMNSLDDKQDVANAGVLYLCGLVHGKKMKLPERIQAEINVVGNSAPSLMGLKDVVEALEPESTNRKCITDGISGDTTENLNSGRPRTLFRRASLKT